MAKSNLDKLSSLLTELWPDDTPHDAYEKLVKAVTSVGDIVRCKPQAALMAQKLSELA